MRHWHSNDDGEAREVRGDERCAHDQPGGVLPRGRDGGPTADATPTG
jgi:hypothetical protein